MKKLKLTFLLTVLMSMVGANAFALEVDGIYYTFYTDSHSAVTYAEVTSGSSEYSGNIVIPESILYNEKACPVRSIASRAFKECTGLTSVIIPNSVIEIGYEAFYGCSSLSAITLPNNLTSIGSNAFYNCLELTSIIIPGSVESIGSSAFSGSGIWNNAPDGVFYVDNWACDYKKTTYSYSNKKSISLLEGTVGIADRAFYGMNDLESITIPNSVTSIGSEAFYGCNKLTSVSIPNSVITIGSKAFQNCTKLTSISIPSSVRNIGSQAFEYTGIYNAAPSGLYYVDNWACGTKGSEALTSVSLLDGTVGVAEHVFYYFDNRTGGMAENRSLTSVTLPNSLKSISNGAFESCYLEGLEAIPSSVTYIGDRAFYAAWPYGGDFGTLTIPNAVTNIGEDAFAMGLMSRIFIGNSVTSIGDYAFANCANLWSVKIGNSVTNIGDGAFANCYQLSDIVIGNSVSSIGRGAFKSCSGESISIPNTVTYIGDEAFYMGDLKSVYVDLKTPLSISPTTFEERDYANATLNVPVGSKSAYESAENWNSFANFKEYVALNESSTAAMEPATDVTAVINRRINFSEWSTICLPFAMTAEQLKNTFGEDVQLKEYTGFEMDGDKINVNFSTVASLEANHPYIINVDYTVNSFAVEGVDIVASTDARVSHTAGGQQLDFVGTLVGDFNFYEAALPNTAFFLSGGQFWQASPTTQHMNAFRAYFSYTGASSSRLNLAFDSEATGIAVHNDNPSLASRTYDLQGRPVQNCQLRPGLYICNGRKTIIR